jgi:hypothetical protein
MRQETGVFIITVFAAPVPLRPGPADISVLVQDRTSQNPVLDAEVFIQTVQATHAQAQNKLLYAASLNLDSPGEWKYSVSVRKGPQESQLTGRLQVAPAQAKIASYWPYLALPPIAILLFLIQGQTDHSRISARISGRISRRITSSPPPP